MSAFRAALMKNIKHCLESEEHRYTDNSYAYYVHLSAEARQQDHAWLAASPLVDFKDFIADRHAKISEEIRLKQYLYSMLEDDYSRDLLVTIASFNLLGHRYVKMPYYTRKNIERRSMLHEQSLYPGKSLKDDPFGKDFQITAGLNINLYDTAAAGLQARMITSDEFLYTLKYCNTYRYDHGGVVIDVEKGDYVLDCGACYGDTALMFADKCSESGRIFSCEPNPLMLTVFKRNLNLNPLLAKNITVIQRAVSSQADKTLKFTLGGPASSQNSNFLPSSNPTIAVKTTTLDTEVKKNSLTKLEFIKMDVEGAELDALQGARKSIEKFKPKLAVCLYHQPADFLDIPQMIKGWELGYKLYLEHHSNNHTETVLYAV